MSSLANRVWTEERMGTALALVNAVYEYDDVEFEAIMDHLAKRPVDLFAVTAILADRFAGVIHGLNESVKYGLNEEDDE